MRVNTDTQHKDPVSWLSLAKKDFKPKTIEVMVATTPPLMQDSYLVSPTGMSRAFLQSVTRDRGDSIRFHTLESLEVDLRTSSLFFEGKQRIVCKIYIQIIQFFH